MSRSIHQNTSRRYFRQRGSYDPEDWAEALKKSRIKRHVRSERRSLDPPSSPITVEQIGYAVEDLPPFLFFPATLDDVQAVLSGLPPGYLNGVTHLTLSSGRGISRVPKSGSWEGLAQILETRFEELEPGVFAPDILGAYSLKSGCIELYAYVLDPAVRLSSTSEMALKMYMLQTLVHEVAHNHDKVQRVARGRWRMDSIVKAEQYADDLSQILFDSVIIPYMRQTYAGSAD